MIVSDEWLESVFHLLGDVACLAEEVRNEASTREMTAHDLWVIQLSDISEKVMGGNNSPFSDGHTLN